MVLFVCGFYFVFLYSAFTSKAAELFFYLNNAFLLLTLRISVADHSLLSCAHKPGQLVQAALLSSTQAEEHGIVSGEVHGSAFLGTAQSTTSPSVLPAPH